MNWDRVERLIGSHNLALLAQKRVGVAGVGSGGGFVALSLAMSGVGQLVLIDADVIKETNIVRHVADRRYLGRPKAEAVADLILARNPAAQVTAIHGRIEDHLDALAGLDLLVVGLDGEGPKYTLNEACLSLGLPAVYAGVYERGEGGDVVLITPGSGPCYACWAAELREEVIAGHEDDSAPLDYGMIGPEGTLEAEPGLWLHVTRVASAQADIALNELLRGTEVYRALPGNTVIIANVPLEIINGQTSFPYTALWVVIERDPQCLVCGTLLGKTADQMAQADVSLDDLMSNTGIVLEEQAQRQSKED